jgi:hypothetical protein
MRVPTRPWEALFRAWLRHAYAPVDAIASVVDPEPDCGREASFPLRLGLHDAFRPETGVPRGDHVLYVGRLARENETFGLAALEAGASGARVVACAAAPSAGLLGDLAHRFDPGDTAEELEDLRELAP